MDATLVKGVLDAARRGHFQGQKAGTRGVHSVRNLVIMSASIVASFLSGAVSSDFATKSALVQRAGSSLVSVEHHIEIMFAELQDDLRIALDELLKEIKKYPNIRDYIPPSDVDIPRVARRGIIR
jgi:hypothetical protein